MGVRLLCTSDWQTSLGNLERCRAMLKQLLEIIDEKSPDWVLHLGDVKDAFNPVDQRVTNFLVEATQEICKRTRMAILLGNHDRISTSEDADDCMPALAAAGAWTITSPETAQLAKHVHVFGVPFSRDPDKVAAAIASHPKVPCGILLFHADIAECEYGFNRPGKGMPLSKLMAEKYAICLGGHVHYHQQIGGPKSNAWYVGSPFCMDWGEANQQKGFMMVDILGNHAMPMFIPSHLPGWYDPDLPGFPKKRDDWDGTTIRLKVRCGVKDPRADIAAATEKASSKYPGAKLHIVPEFGIDVDAPEKVRLEGADAQLVRSYITSIGETAKAGGIGVEEAIAYTLAKLPGGGTGLQGLKFLEVRAENVLCFDKVTLDLATPGLTLVTGHNDDWQGRSNGAGKSATMSLPLLGLFGRTPKGQSHDEWKRRGGKGLSQITLNMTLGDGRSCTIQRSRPAGLEVKVAGEIVTMGDVRATQAMIETLTGLTWDVIVNSLYIGQKEVGIILTGTMKERKELFSRFLGLERFLVAQEAMRKDFNACKRAITEVEAETMATEARIAEAEDWLKSIPPAKPVAKRVLEDARGHYGAARKAWETTKEEERELAKELIVARSKESETMRDCTRAASLLEHAEEALTKFQNAKQGSVQKCPLCGQAVAAKFAGTHLAELQQQIATYQAAFEKANEIHLPARRKSLAAQKALDTCRSSIDDLRGRMEAKRGIYEMLQAAAKAEEIREGEIRKVGARIAHLKVVRGYHQKYFGYLNGYQSLVSFCTNMVVGRDGLPQYLCATAVPSLNHAASRFSNAFSEGEIQVLFTLEGGEIDIDVVNAHGGKSMTDQSTGETRIASLITLFAFRDVLVPHDILILDEPGEGMDAVNAKAFATGLAEVVDRFGSVFLTTHNPNILAAIDPVRHLEVRKRNGISTVKEVTHG